MPDQKHACRDNDCSHICLLSKNSTYSCACPENMKLSPDQHTCKANEKVHKIILGIGRTIVSIPQQTFGGHVSEFDDVHDPIDAIEFNSLTGELFVTQNRGKLIVSVNMKTQQGEILVMDFMEKISSMAFGEFRLIALNFSTDGFSFQIISPTTSTGWIRPKERSRSYHSTN